MATPAAWQNIAPSTSPDWPQTDWWHGFGSTQLDDYIARAQAGNDDIAAAIARVREADAQARIAGAALLPTLDGGASASLAGGLAEKHVVVLDDLVHGHRAALDGEVPLYEGCVGDRSLVERITREHKIEACIHFAALTSVGESVTDPRKYFENNVAQSIAFIGALVPAGVRRVVISSTAAVYGEPKQFPFPNRVHYGR